MTSTHRVFTQPTYSLCLTKNWIGAHVYCAGQKDWCARQSARFRSFVQSLCYCESFATALTAFKALHLMFRKQRRLYAVFFSGMQPVGFNCNWSYYPCRESLPWWKPLQPPNFKTFVLLILTIRLVGRIQEKFIWPQRRPAMGAKNHFAFSFSFLFFGGYDGGLLLASPSVRASTRRSRSVMLPAVAAKTCIMPLKENFVWKQIPIEIENDVSWEAECAHCSPWLIGCRRRNSQKAALRHVLEVGHLSQLASDVHRTSQTEVWLVNLTLYVKPGLCLPSTSLFN